MSSLFQDIILVCLNAYLLLLNERDRRKIREKNKKNTSAHMQETAQQTKSATWELDGRVKRK